MIAGASYILATVSGRKLWVGLLLAILLMALSKTADKPVEPEVSIEDHTPAEMAAAVSYMQRSIPQGDRILVDFQSSLPMTYYFCGPRNIIAIETFQGNYFEFTCNGYPIVSLKVWKLIPRSFPMQFEKMARAHDLKPGDRVWVYQTGWGDDLGSELAAHDAAFRCLAPTKFGGGVTVTPFVVGADFSPQPPLGDCARTQN